MLDMIKAVFAIGPIQYKLVFLCAGINVLAGINLLLIFPIVFNYFIIPGIEERCRKNIIFPIFLNYIVLGRFMYGYILVSRYITATYFLFKLRKFKGVRSIGVLAPLDYSIKLATKFEVFMSIMTFVNMGIVVLTAIGILVFAGSL